MNKYIDNVLNIVQDHLDLPSTNINLNYHKDYVNSQDFNHFINSSDKWTSWKDAIHKHIQNISSWTHAQATLDTVQRRALIRQLCRFALKEKNGNALLQCIVGLCDNDVGSIDEILYILNHELDMQLDLIVSDLFRIVSNLEINFQLEGITEALNHISHEKKHFIVRFCELIACYCRNRVITSPSFSSSAWSVLERINEHLVDHQRNVKLCDKSNLLVSLHVQTLMICNECSYEYAISRVKILLCSLLNHQAAHDLNGQM